jgi:hypothetical protein
MSRLVSTRVWASGEQGHSGSDSSSSGRGVRALFAVVALARAFELGARGDGRLGQGGAGRGDEGEEELFSRPSRCGGGDGKAKEA